MRNTIRAAAAAFAVALTMSAGHPTFAAHGKAGAPGAGRMAKMANSLGLTDAQKAQIKPILMSARQQSKAVKADTSLTPAAQKTKIMAIRKTMMQQIAAILTPAQKATLKQDRKNHKPGAPGAG